MTSNLTRALRLVLGIVVSSCPYCLPARACSAVGCLNGGIELNHNFRIAITFQDQPLAGVNIQVRGNGREANYKTDAKGEARILKLATGEYWLTADFLGISAAYDCFHVNESPSQRSKSKLKFSWGENAPSVRVASGKLVDLQSGKGGNAIWNIIHRIEVPIAGATLRLQDPVNGSVYMAASDDQGQFAFGSVPSGTYALHIEGGKAGDRDYDATDQLIDLDARASRSDLVFVRRDAAAGSCGGTSLELRDPK